MIKNIYFVELTISVGEFGWLILPLVSMMIAGVLATNVNAV